MPALYNTIQGRVRSHPFRDETAERMGHGKFFFKRPERNEPSKN
jgi:hypothetical protein